MITFSNLKDDNYNPAGYVNRNYAAEQASGKKFASELEANKTQPSDTKSTETLQEAAKIEELKQRDSEVKKHEEAHIAAGGMYINGGAKYTYQIGPDGKRYATGGSVNIDTGEVPGDPAATLRKANVIRAAALAPADPSAQDLRVAAAASEMARSAQEELNSTEVQSSSKTNGYNSSSMQTSTISVVM